MFEFSIAGQFTIFKSVSIASTAQCLNCMTTIISCDATLLVGPLPPPGHQVWVDILVADSKCNQDGGIGPILLVADGKCNQGEHIGAQM